MKGELATKCANCSHKNAFDQLTAAQESAQEQLELAVDAANEWAMQYVEIDNAPMRVGDFIRAELSKEKN